MQERETKEWTPNRRLPADGIRFAADVLVQTAETCMHVSEAEAEMNMEMETQRFELLFITYFCVTTGSGWWKRTPP